MKKLITAFFCVLISVCILGGCNGENPPTADVKHPELKKQTSYTKLETEEYILCAESDDLKLFFQPSTTHFKVENINDASVWYSNPQNAESDTYAKKLVQMQMMSTLVVEYINIGTQKTTELNLYTAAVRSKKYNISLITNGVCFEYAVSEIGKSVFLAVTLEDGYINTDVWFEDFGEKKSDIYISAISIAPYFVSGALEDEGYLFLPDGSGALVSFNNNYATQDSYSRPIYGEEPTNVTADYYLQASEHAIRIPVYGVRRNGSAMMAVVTNGAQMGTLKANSCCQQSSYANAYVSYRFLNSIEFDVGNYSTVIYDESEIAFDKITTRYYFLSGDNANYSGMARKYRDYLQKEYNLQNNTVSNAFYADIYGGVIKRVSTLGVPHNKLVPLTTTAQLDEIVQWLNENGVNNISVRYRSWNTDELKGNRVNSASHSQKLSINKIAKIKNAQIYPAVLQLQSYSNGGFFDSLANSAYSISGLPFQMNGYSKANLQETDEKTYWTAATKLQNNVTKLLDGIKKWDISNLALGDIGSKLYCDFRDDGYRRSESLNLMLSLLEKSSENFDSLMLDAANNYAAVYADVIYNTPITHSNQDILEQSVPFYSMVFSGITDCVAPAYNSDAASDDLLLYAAGSGTYLCASWMYEDVSSVLTTSLNHLTNVNFTATRDEAIKLYNKLSSVYESAYGSVIYSHAYLTDTITVTTYENGTKVYVNFSDSEYAVSNNLMVGAKSFIVVKGDK